MAKSYTGTIIKHSSSFHFYKYSKILNQSVWMRVRCHLARCLVASLPLLPRFFGGMIFYVQF